MSLDNRAARAARSLRTSVAGVSPVDMPVVIGRQRRSLFTSFAVAAVAVLLFAGLASAMPNLFEPDQLATDQLPDDGAPLVVEPDDKEGDGQLVDLEHLASDIAVHQRLSQSDSSRPYTVFYGAAEPGSVVTAVSAFGEASTTANEDGQFELKLWFDTRPPAGEEFPILVTADGRDYEFDFTCWFDPDNVEITAHQTYGASDDAEAFEKFFGTAPPGTIILATSPFGSADAVAGEDGHWKLKLWFEGPLPLDEPFEITVTVGDEIFTFPFVAIFEDQWPLVVHQVNTVSDSKNPYVLFEGTAAPGTHLLAQSEYGAHDIVVGESGEFSLKLWFSPRPPAGVTFPIAFKVNHELYETFYFKSLYEPPAGGEVTVHQHNTASESSSPWVKFYGTAPVGTHIQIISEYGSWSWNTEAYEWNSGKKFFEPLPPQGEPFTITVKINGNVFGTYQFTSWFDPNQIIIEPVKFAAEGPEPYTRIEYWAPAGTTIQLISDYGSSSKTLEATGGGDLKLWFSPLPPAGVPFNVTIKVNGEIWETYQFTSWWDPSAIEITVNHAFESCSEAEPYDDLWGTAPPGTLIDIISPFGSTSFTVGEWGGWEKRQFFTGATYGEPFTVTVKANGDVILTYQFVVYAPA